MVIFTNGGELIVHINPEKIVVEAIDSGPGISDIKKAMEPGYSTAPDFIRELGFGAGMVCVTSKSVQMICIWNRLLKKEPD